MHQYTVTSRRTKQHSAETTTARQENEQADSANATQTDNTERQNNRQAGRTRHQQSKAQPQVPASNFLPDPQISNMFAQNVDPTTGLTSTQTALLSPEEQVIAKRLRT